jgi:hypothetical protein
MKAEVSRRGAASVSRQEAEGKKACKQSFLSNYNGRFIYADLY